MESPFMAIYRRTFEIERQRALLPPPWDGVTDHDCLMAGAMRNEITVVIRYRRGTDGPLPQWPRPHLSVY
jgi:hypothetical protein